MNASPLPKVAITGFILGGPPEDHCVPDVESLAVSDVETCNSLIGARSPGDINPVEPASDSLLGDSRDPGFSQVS